MILAVRGVWNRRLGCGGKMWKQAKSNAAGRHESSANATKACNALWKNAAPDNPRFEVKLNLSGNRVNQAL
jgi:hypothetical protein